MKEKQKEQFCECEQCHKLITFEDYDLYGGVCFDCVCEQL